MKILVTGAAGYIGGTFAYEALKKGFKVFGIDSFINSSDATPALLKENFNELWNFSNFDLATQPTELEKLFQRAKPDIVVHFAGLKAVEESEEKPFMYWKNNLLSSLNILNCMTKYNVTNLIFSSSATVYGDSKEQPVTENHEIKSISTYGSTKIAIEQLIKDFSKTNTINAVSLRYFNPVGSHSERIIYENPYDYPNNLMPRIIRVALGIDKEIKIYGKNYKTSDGTGERDYIHISDLIDGHFSSIDFLNKNTGCYSFNIGTGKPTSVIKLIEAFEDQNDIKIPFSFSERRKGDVERCYADPRLAEKQLGWKAQLGIEEMCKSAWEAVKDGPN